MNENGPNLLNLGVTYLFAEGSNIQSSEGCLFCRFEDNGAPSSKCWTPLPGKHQNGVVPGDDLPHYSNWLFACQAEQFSI
jgi:hypothetical protein